MVLERLRRLKQFGLERNCSADLLYQCRPSFSRVGTDVLDDGDMKVLSVDHQARVDQDIVVLTTVFVL